MAIGARATQLYQSALVNKCSYGRDDNGEQSGAWSRRIQAPPSSLPKFSAVVRVSKVPGF